ncbi:MAG: hypothetical protein AB1547_04170 [Thermodesulfobacteriota bacterium]
MTEAFEFPIQRLAELEKTVALVYDRFADRFPEDRDFWLRLRNEEYEHEAILNNIQTLQQDVQVTTKSPSEFSDEVATMMIGKIQSLLDEAHRQELTRKEALAIALQLEQSAGEFHFRCICNSHQKQMDKYPQLWKNDFEHSARIRTHLEETMHP